MASFLRKLFGRKKRKANPKKDSVTGRNTSFPVPYLSRLEGLMLQPGQSLIVRGTIIGRSEFIINLTTGARVEIDEETDGLDNRLLSIRVDVSAKRAYLNACIDGEWGKEGAVKHTWEAGSDFDIRVRCHEHAYDIFLDYKLVATFAHYLPLTDVTHVYINGDVELCAVTWEGKYYQTPYAADLPGNMYTGRKLQLCGALVGENPESKPRGFAIDFHAGSNIALHIEPNLATKKIIRRSCVDNVWSEQEVTSSAGFPFKKRANRLYEVVVSCRDDEYLIYVNDEFVCSFAHVIPPRKVDRIVVSGDVSLHGIHLK